MPPATDYERRITFQEKSDMLRGLEDGFGFVLGQRISLAEEREAILDDLRPIIEKNQGLTGFEREFCEILFAEMILPPRYFEIVRMDKELQQLYQALTSESGTVPWEELKARAKERSLLDVVTLAKLKKLGTKWTSFCPIHHEKTPSFLIYPDKHFKCFGCGASGDVIDLAMKALGMDFNQAVKHLGGAQ